MIDLVIQANYAPADEGKGLLSILYKKISEARCITTIVQLDKERGEKTMSAVAEKMGVRTVDILESMRKDDRLVRCFINGAETLDLYEALRPIFFQLAGKEATIEEMVRNVSRKRAMVAEFMRLHSDIPQAFGFTIVEGQS